MLLFPLRIVSFHLLTNIYEVPQYSALKSLFRRRLIR